MSRLCWWLIRTRRIEPLGRNFRRVSCFSDQRCSKPARLRTIRKSLYVNEAMLDLDQRAQLPISFTSSYGLDVGQMVGSVRAHGVSIAVLEVLLRVVLNRFDQISQGRIGGRKLRHKIQLWTLGTIVTVVVR